MATERGVSKIKLLEGLCDVEFQKLAQDKSVLITGITDGLTKEGEAIRVVDFVRCVGEPVYTKPLC